MILWGVKDGGPLSRVWMYGIEFKRFGTLALLKFEDGSREAYHDHAFNSVSLVLSGCLVEARLFDGEPPVHTTFRRGRIVFTSRKNLHRVYSVGRSWVLTVRGPWAKEWHEFIDGRLITLRWGRVNQ